MTAKAGFGAALLVALLCGTAPAEVCTTQSQMQPPERSALAQTALDFARRVQGGDSSGIRSLTIAKYAQDFGGIASAIADTGSRIKGSSLQVESIFLLDASAVKAAGNGPDAAAAQFFCSLNQTAAETDFLIPGLPPGQYAFAVVSASGTAPWQLSFLFQQEQGQWKMAGFYPKPLTAAGHDGLWYWTTARSLVQQKHSWSAWLYYQQAETLLQPAGFVSSTHFEKLRAEQIAGAPPALSEGVSAEAPLVVKGKGDAEYHFTVLVTDDSFSKDKVDVVAHLKVDQVGDAAAARKSNIEAMSALLAAYPELRQSFHGVWIFAEAAGQSPVATELSMAEIPS